MNPCVSLSASTGVMADHTVLLQSVWKDFYSEVRLRTESAEDENRSFNIYFPALSICLLHLF